MGVGIGIYTQRVVCGTKGNLVMTHLISPNSWSSTLVEEEGKGL